MKLMSVSQICQQCSIGSYNGSRFSSFSSSCFNLLEGMIGQSELIWKALDSFVSSSCQVNHCFCFCLCHHYDENQSKTAPNHFTWQTYLLLIMSKFCNLSIMPVLYFFENRHTDWGHHFIVFWIYESHQRY